MDTARLTVLALTLLSLGCQKEARAQCVDDLIEEWDAENFPDGVAIYHDEDGNETFRMTREEMLQQHQTYCARAVIED